MDVHTICLCFLFARLSGFQNHLGSISGEIKHLQDESLSMNVKLTNRKVGAARAALCLLPTTSVVDSSRVEDVGHRKTSSNQMPACDTRICRHTQNLGRFGWSTHPVWSGYCKVFRPVGETVFSRDLQFGPIDKLPHSYS